MGSESKVETHHSRILAPTPNATQPKDKNLNQWLQRHDSSQRRVVAVDDTTHTRQHPSEKERFALDTLQRGSTVEPKDQNDTSVPSDVPPGPQQVLVGSDETKQHGDDDALSSNLELRHDAESTRLDVTIHPTKEVTSSRQRQFSPANRMPRALTREVSRVSPGRHGLSAERMFAPWRLLHTWGTCVRFC